MSASEALQAARRMQEAAAKAICGLCADNVKAISNDGAFWIHSELDTPGGVGYACLAGSIWKLDPKKVLA